MRTFIVLAVLGMCSAFPQGAYQGPLAATIPASLPGAGPNVAPTADVAAATAEFFRAYQAAVQATLPKASRQPPRWTGPVAATVPAGLPGSSANVADTADVQAARAAFSAAFQQQLRAVAARV